MNPFKNSIDQLAIFGGPPAFDEPLHVGRPNVGDRERLFARFNDILDRRMLTNRGPYVQEFERRIAAETGAAQAVVVCNATAGLEALIHALDLRGEVLLPSFTFVATAHALRWLGIKPVFCDIDARTHTLDPERVEAGITPQTTAILGVHVWGRACPDEALADIARRHGLRLIYDAAHAFGCSYQGRMIGCLGQAEVFSFHATKFLNSFEGGAVTTNDAALADRLRLMINFGFRGYDNVLSLGVNAKMPEVSAAMGITSLEAMPEIIAHNYENYCAYRRALDPIPGVRLYAYDPLERNNYQYIVVEVQEPAASLDRDTLVACLHAEKVLARRYFYPGVHCMPPYCDEDRDAGQRLPVTEALTRRVMTLPTGTAIGAAEIEAICALISLMLANGRRIRRRLAASEARP